MKKGPDSKFFERNMQRFKTCLEDMKTLMRDGNSPESGAIFTQLNLIYEELDAYVSSYSVGGSKFCIQEASESNFIQDNEQRFKQCLEQMKSLMTDENSSESKGMSYYLSVIHEALRDQIILYVSSSSGGGPEICTTEGSEAKIFEDKLKKFMDCAEEAKSLMKDGNFSGSSNMLFFLYLIHERLEDHFSASIKTQPTSSSGSQVSTREGSESSLPSSSKTKAGISSMPINKNQNRPTKKGPKKKETKVCGPKQNSSVEQDLEDEMALQEHKELRMGELEKVNCDLEKENEQLTTANKTLNSANKELTTTNETLNSENKKLRTRLLDALRLSQSQLNEANRVYQKDKDTIMKDLSLYEKRIALLEEQNGNLRKAYNDLTSDLVKKADKQREGASADAG